MKGTKPRVRVRLTQDGGILVMDGCPGCKEKQERLNDRRNIRRRHGVAGTISYS